MTGANRNRRDRRFFSRRDRSGLFPALSAIFLLLNLINLPSLSADQAQSLYKDLSRSCDQGRPADAAKTYLLIRQNFPSSPFTVKAELRLIETNRDYFNTLASYRVFLKDHPDYSGQDAVYYRLGQLYYIHNNFTEAQTAFGTVVSNYPASPYRPAALYWTANILFYRTESAAAAGLFREAADSGDRLYSGLSAVRLGDIAFEKKQYWSAITNYKTALKSATDPEVRIEAGFYLAESYFNVLNNAEAVKYYRDISRNNKGTEFGRLSDERLEFIYMKSPWLRKGAADAKKTEPGKPRTSREKPKYFYIQAGSFTDLRLANNLRLELKKYGFNAGLKRAVEGDHYLYKVRVGQFDAKDSADRVGDEINQKLKLEVFSVQEEE